MIENGIARFDIAQKIDKRNLIRLRTRKRAHDEIEISRSKPRPTIRSDHRDLILRERRAYGKSDYKGVPRNTGILFAKGRIRPVCGPVRYARFEPARFKTPLPLGRVYGNRIACCARLLPRIFCCDVPDLPGDRNRLERIRTRKLLQKLLDLCGFVVSDNHINLSLTLSQRQRVDLWKLSPPVSRPSM